MKKLSCLIMPVVCGFMLMTLGCNSGESTYETVPSMYEVGQVERVRFVRQDFFNSWVEMPDEPRAAESKRELVEELVLRREVESVNLDGSVVMKVTFEKIDVVDKRQPMPGNEYELRYSSTPEKTESTQPDEPALAGTSYRVMLGPDTTVKMVMGLDQLRKEVGLTENLNVIASRFLQEEYIKLIHEREFLQSGVQSGAQATKLFPVRHVMNKAQALEKTFRPQKTQTPQGHPALAVNMTGEAVYVLPEGWPEPPVPPDPQRTLLKDISDMQDPEISGESLFDLSTGQVLHDNNKVKCVLIITEDKISQQTGTEVKEGSGGQLFTVVELEHKFETLSK